MRSKVRAITTVLLALAMVAVTGAENTHAATLAAPGSHPRQMALQSLPAAPFIDAVAPRGLGALLTWEPNAAGDGVTGYTAAATAVSASPPAGCASPTPTTAAGGDTSAEVAGLCAGVAYTIALTATNSAGTGPASASSNPVVPLPAQAPAEPIITSVYSRSGALDVSWTAPDDDGGVPLTGYTLTAKGGTATVKVTPSATSTETLVTGLNNGTKYKLSLDALNSAGASTPATATATPKAAAYAPGPPQHVSATPNTSAQVVASWNPPPDSGGDAVTSYALTYQQVALSSKGVWKPKTGSTPTTVTGITATSYTLTTLQASAYYSISVAATSAAGTGTAASTSGPVTPTTQLQPNAVVLTSATMAALASDVGGTLTWPAPAPAQIASLTAGQVLVAATAPAAPTGLLVTVLTITQPTSGTYVLTTAPAKLSDAVATGSLAVADDPAAMAGAHLRASAPGVRLIRSASAGFDFSTTWTLALNIEVHNADNSCTVCPSVSLNGEVDVTPTVSVNLTVDPTNGATLQALGEVHASANATLEADGTWQHEITEIDGEPFVVFIGDIPIVLVPKVPIYVNLSGGVAIGVTVDMTVGGSMTWNSRNPGTLTTTNLSKAPTLSAGVLSVASVSTTASIGLEAGPELSIFDVTGPEVSAELVLAATVNFGSQPFFTLNPEIQIHLEWHIDLLSWKAKLEVTLGTLVFPGFTINTGPTTTVSITPATSAAPVGQPLALTATRSDHQADTFVWSLLDGTTQDVISSTGANTATLTPAGPAGRHFIVVARGTTGLIGQSDIVVGSPFDPPQNLVATTNTPGTATISWSAPPSGATGGSSLAAYTLVTAPSTGTVTLASTATGTTLSGLNPATDYVIDVYASNTGGLTSPPATALLGQAAAWQIVPSPNIIQGSNQLYSASCPSATFCMTAGQWTESGSPATLALRWDGTGWHLTVPINQGTSNNELDGVSCPSVTFCVAVGWYQNPSYFTQAQEWTSSSVNTWSAMSTVSPGVGDQLLSVSCVSSTFCTAGGFYDDSSGNRNTLIENWNGTSWQVETSPNSSDTYNEITGISCTSAVFCMATGFGHVQFTTSFEPLALEWNGSTWSAVATPNPGGATTFSSVSCVGTTFCMAGGNQAGANPLTERWNGSAWSVVGSPQSGAPSINGISCVSSSICFAVSGGSQTFVDQWDGQSWTLVPSANSTAAANDLFGVSCATPSFCVGAGYDSVAPGQTLIESS